jgi:hypothetical protein
MNEDVFNMSIRKFLKTVGVKSQHEIEQAVARARGEGRISGGAPLPATMTLRIPALDLEVQFDGRIELE